MADRARPRAARLTLLRKPRPRRLPWRREAISPPTDKPLAHLNHRDWGPPRRVHTLQQEEEYRQGFKALMLSTSLATYHALLRGEEVPISQLDPKWVERYGLNTRRRVA